MHSLYSVRDENQERINLNPTSSPIQPYNGREKNKEIIIIRNLKVLLIID